MDDMSNIDDIADTNDIDEEGGIPATKQRRILFPLSFMLFYIDPKHLAKKKYTKEQAHEAFGPFYRNVLVYTFDRHQYASINEFCEAFGIDEEFFGTLYYGEDYNPESDTLHSGEATARIEEEMRIYEETFGKKSATVMISINFFKALYDGTMPHHRFAVAVAVMSRLGNRKKTKRNPTQIITYAEKKARMLGYTQWDHPIAQAAVAKTHLTDGRIKSAEESFDNKLFFRHFDGRRCVFGSLRTFHNSRDEFIDYLAKKKARKQFGNRNQTREDKIRIAQVVRQEVIKHESKLAQQIHRQFPKKSGRNLSEVLDEIAILCDVRLHREEALDQNQLRSLTTFHCDNIQLVAIKPLTSEQIKRIQEMLDTASGKGID